MDGYILHGNIFDLLKRMITATKFFGDQSVYLIEIEQCAWTDKAHVPIFCSQYFNKDADLLHPHIITYMHIFVLHFERALSRALHWMYQFIADTISDIYIHICIFV